MCGIIISNKIITEDKKLKIKKRGPDKENIIEYKGFYFYHCLLSLTGEETIQPLKKDNIIILFNGEIYNYLDLLPGSKSDIFCIYECYTKYKNNFVNYLDGEFVIVIFDFNINKIIIATDIFKTKPLFYIFEEEITIASYESAFINKNINSVKTNELLIYDIETKNIQKNKIHKFDLHQYKDNYDDFNKTLEESILKRYSEKYIPVVSLSSGLDSGAIACCLNKYNKNFLAITIPKNENIEVIKKRKNILKDRHILINLEDNKKVEWKKYLKENCETFIWDWTWNHKVNKIDNGFDMGSMLGKCEIIKEAKKYNIKILYSGIGADEIMSKNKYYSCGFGNVDYFPDNLDSVFPWKNFFQGCMENYLKGDEYVGGCFGFETRYPFCDKKLVQEFLWLKPELKNSYYEGKIRRGRKIKNYYSDIKSPLVQYLKINNFPYTLKKLGFNV